MNIRGGVRGKATVTMRSLAAYPNSRRFGDDEYPGNAADPIHAGSSGPSHAARSSLKHVRVDHRRVDFAVTQQLLHSPVVVAVQEMVAKECEGRENATLRSLAARN
jgi:hypothetical protein